jgi:hypothetical protein
VDFVAYHCAPPTPEIIEHFTDPRIKHGLIKQVFFVMFEKYAPDLLKVLWRRFGNRVFEQVINPTPDMAVNQARRQWHKIESATGKVYGIGEIPSCIGQGSVQIKHHQIDRALHCPRFKLKTILKSTHFESLFALRPDNVVIWAQA